MAESVYFSDGVLVDDSGTPLYLSADAFGGSTPAPTVIVSQADYDALDPPDPDTLYAIVG